MTKTRLVSFIAPLIFFCTPAFAVDGVVLIDQLRAAVGFVTPGDAPGFPVTITRPGSYQLSGNLLVPANTNGFVVNAADVTINLNGFRLNGTKGGQYLAGIRANQPNLRVHNGTIRGFQGDAIQIHEANTIVEDMLLFDNGSGVFQDDPGGNFRVINNSILGNENYGIACVQACYIAGNYIANSNVGVAIRSGSMIDNTIHGQSQSGIQKLGSDPAGFGGNTLFNNTVQIEAGGSGLITMTPNACSPAC